MTASQPHSLSERITEAMLADQFPLQKAARRIRERKRRGQPVTREEQKLEERLAASVARRRKRAALVPKIEWDESLPVVQQRESLSRTIADHQVVVVCGETGSGKSTQLPLIALSLGRGIAGSIAHTQPRRIAARSVAARLSEQTATQPGAQFGYRIRFHDESGPDTLACLMTDGILLAETRSDQFLNAYDTIIVDEAHERSLNIDFLLGYLRRLQNRRRDLKIIITSATIDAERFAAHFSDADRPAPVVEVSGRTYPVEVRFRPPEADEHGEPPDPETQLATAVRECLDNGPGDILVFLPTERDIREAAKSLGGLRVRHESPEILSLFGRLSIQEQQKVFRRGSGRRIVLSTNVAESSLTVPGIRYVIDQGTARISRYSARSRMQRLPIEAVARASADQRAGRCGRIGPGICIRLYSEEDYESRDRFTTPEIQRTNLASVILTMLNLRLGDPESFPFPDPPRPTTVREGYQTLRELGAVDDDLQITPLGREMARFPTEPRISRMILAAIEEHALPEVLIIAAVLELQDPRERPLEKQQQADEAHARFIHKHSDFLTLLNLWDAWQEQKKKSGSAARRRWCRDHFLNWLRMREWEDIHRQLRDLVTERSSGNDRERLKQALKSRHNDEDAVHRSLLTGLLANIGMRKDDTTLVGANNSPIVIWPGSALSRKSPRWFVGAELLETSRRFVRTVTRIRPEWIEAAAEHLVKRDYTEPRWDEQAGNVLVSEQVTLWGLPIVPRRAVPYARIDMEKCRDMFIRYGLAEFGLLPDNPDQQDFDEEAESLQSGGRSRMSPGRGRSATGQLRARRAKEFPFLNHNREVLQQLQQLQAKSRRHDLVPSDDDLYEYYENRLPQDVADRTQLKRWFQRASRHDPHLLKLNVDQFLTADHRDQHEKEFPAEAVFGSGLRLPLSYQLTPGEDHDGVTVSVPCEGVSGLDEARLSWLVPGLLEEKVLALIRTLPKAIRRSLVPAPDSARRACEALAFGKGNLQQALASVLSRIAGEPIRAEQFDLTALPDHLRFRIVALNADGSHAAESRDLVQLRRLLHASSSRTTGGVGSVRPTPELNAAEKQWHRQGFTGWDFADIPPRISIQRAGMTIRSYPSMNDDGESVSLTLCQTPQEAEDGLRSGLRRLLMLNERKRVRDQVRNLPGIGQWKMQFSCIRGLNLENQLMLAMTERAYLCEKQLPRNQAAYEAVREAGRKRLGSTAQEFVQLYPLIIRDFHRVRRSLEEASGPGWNEVLDDLRLQLNELIHSRFPSTTPWPWLIQYPRYLNAMTVRVKRLHSGGLKTEVKLQQQLTPWLTDYRERRREHEEANRREPLLEHFRWMLEEYRVAVFAQKLGTAITVSEQKLLDVWSQIPTC